MNLFKFPKFSLLKPKNAPNDLSWKIFKYISTITFPADYSHPHFFSSKASAGSIGRSSYHAEVEKAVNEQIVAEFNAMYMYLSMASYFGRTDVALPGCYGFFMDMHIEEHEHGLIFLNYQNMRGGKVVLGNIQLAPDKICWDGIRSAFATAAEMEKSIKDKLLAVNCVAEKHRDYGVIDLITSYFIPAQDRSICEMSRLLQRITKMGKEGVAEYLFDKEVHTAFVQKGPKPYIPDYPNAEKDAANKKDLYI
ncbi:hypothetical protein PPYR_07319 [Photinus pyralis]|uniref:Ferritin n=1 Tax=Photinus pyralis TaxID=7054 RepID=A0A1Y1JUR3_PHOPY|nr:ferritin-1 heavy chain-like [Photinus pyralis]KAB0799439.1 hypothetical protein PPYR_07319 [Photinus pyralis]